MITNNTEQIIERFILQSKEKKNDILFFSLAIPTEYCNSFNILSNIQQSEKAIFFAKSKHENFSFLAFGSIYDIKIDKHDYLDITKNEIINIQSKIFSNHKLVGIKCLPFFLGGIKFNDDAKFDMWNDYAFSDWFIPRFVFFEKQNNTYLILNFYKSLPTKNEILETLSYALKLSAANTLQIKKNMLKEISNTNEEWETIVNTALQEISNGRLKKVVLSRYKKYEMLSNYNIADLVDRLSQIYPQTLVFVFRRGASFFIGATPELFLSYKNNEIHTEALAGSIKRGRSKTEDDELAIKLLENNKERNEHALVVDFVLKILSNYSSNIIYDATPKVKKLSNVQHLRTKIKAKLNDESSLFEVMNELYPTPAIGGFPVKEAKQMITELEKYPRGLYAGLIGWINLDQGMELYIGIRSALIKNNLLLIFAGCGIVEGSTPIQEFQETEIKVKPILNLFTDE